MTFTSEEVLNTLRTRFGHDHFRGPQEAMVKAVLDGRDVLFTLPTGGGKSLVYQLPALMLDGLTLVVSPLIALMKDQTDGLRARGIRAAEVNSSVPPKERTCRLEMAARGELDLLFVTPERFRSPTFLKYLPKLNVTRLAIDEAHCISHWGHDFRPDYHRLGLYRKRLGSPPTIALTATATPQVAEDIASSLELNDPVIHCGGIERENLFLSATRVHLEEDKISWLASRIAAIEGAGIVYSTLIRDLERLHDELRRRGIPSLVYHGKLSNNERRQMQERFMASPNEVVLATNAFGMGVDKADIRFVFHAQIPRTLEAWAQEVGRAGRDDKPALCELLYFEEDIAIQQNFINWANPSREYLVGVYETLRGWGERLQAKDLDDLRDELLIKNRGDNRVSISLKWLEVLGVTGGSFETHNLRLVKELDLDELPDFVGSEEKLRTDLEGLLGMVRFATGEDVCRRQTLNRHFGLPESDEGCGHCDVCEDVNTWCQSTFQPREKAAPTESKAQAKAPFERGDWVQVGGRGLAQVTRVDGEGSKVRLTIEDSKTLKRRTIDTRRVRVERLESPSP
ncbi:MAG: ATP-dependent DNA helicase RecQ [Planctomycetota bacterium]|jgi:ATP-dependent DNA helicase RecQ